MYIGSGLDKSVGRVKIRAREQGRFRLSINLIYNMRTAVYAGSFDPLTNGHLWMIDQGARLFDKLIVAVGTNPDKGYTFTLEERMEMLSEALVNNPFVEVAHFHNRFLVDFAMEEKASYILRGIRTSTDYEYERLMRHINNDMAPEITTIFLMPPRDIAELSSSMVKGLIGPVGWESQVKRYVPDHVFRLMMESYTEIDEAE